MLYEYRSDSRRCLEQMERMLQALVAAYRAMGIEVLCERIGERPCTGDVDPVREQALVDRAAAAMKRQLGMAPKVRSGSTDCNIPLSEGIAAIAVGGCRGVGVHTREEYLELRTLEPGTRFIMDLLRETFYN